MPTPKWKTWITPYPPSGRGDRAGVVITILSRRWARFYRFLGYSLFLQFFSFLHPHGALPPWCINGIIFQPCKVSNSSSNYPPNDNRSRGMTIIAFLHRKLLLKLPRSNPTKFNQIQPNPTKSNRIWHVFIQGVQSPLYNGGPPFSLSPPFSRISNLLPLNGSHAKQVIWNRNTEEGKNIMELKCFR